MARNIRFDLITNYNPRGVRAADAHLRGLQARVQRISVGFRRSFQNMEHGVEEFNSTFAGLAHVWSLVKIPAMIAGVKLLTSALVSAGAGAVSFVSSIAPAAGALAALPQLFLGIAGTAGVVKLATGGIGDALKALGSTGPGSAEKIKKAMQGLPPPTRAFVKDLNKLRPELTKLKLIAATPIMGAFRQGLQAVKPLLPLVREGVRQTAREIGRFVSGAASIARTSLFKSTAASILKTNTIALRSLGGAGLNLSRALIFVARDAQPLVRWLIQLSSRLANTAAAFLTAEAKSGGLRRFFTDSRNAISRLVRIFGNLGTILVVIFGQGKDLGDSLLVSLVKLTAKWREFVTSGEGRETIAEVFERAKGPLIEAAKLIGDVAKLIGHLAKSESLGPIISQVRTELLPSVGALSDAFDHITPVIVDALVKLGRLFSAIIAQDGGLIHVVGTIGAMAGAFANLLEQHPALANFASALTILAPSITAIKFISMVTGVRAVVKAFLGGKTAILAAQTAFVGVKNAALLTRIELAALRIQTIAIAVASRIASVAAKAWAVAQRLLNLVLLANPIGLVIAALALLVVGIVLAYKKSETFRKIVDKVWTILKLGALDFVAKTVAALKFLVNIFLTVVGSLVSGAAKAFGWVPGIGPKLKGAATAFDKFKKDVNTALQNIHDKTVDVKARAFIDTKELRKGLQAIRSNAFIGLATGGRIPGFGGGDRVPILAERGEAVVDKYRASRYSGVLRAMGVPGFQGGGVIPRSIFTGVGAVARGAAGAQRAMERTIADSVRVVAESAITKAFTALAGRIGGVNLAGIPAGRAGIVQLARTMVTARWGPAQWPPFFKLEMGEAGFNPFARNRSSGAFGIPQALPPSKMPLAARNLSVAGSVLAMAAAQLRWMLGYIASRYGTPARAYASWLSRSPHWYQQGAWKVPFNQAAFVHAGEMIIPSRAADQIRRRGGGGGNTFNITINAHPTNHPADLGATLVEAIRYYEKRNGKGWRI